MMNPTLETEIREQLSLLPLEQQRQVLEFARALATARVRGVPGQALLRFSGLVDTEDLATMKQAIEEGCEQVQANEW